MEGQDPKRIGIGTSYKCAAQRKKTLLFISRYSE